MKKTYKLFLNLLALYYQKAIGKPNLIRAAFLGAAFKQTISCTVKTPFMTNHFQVKDPFGLRIIWVNQLIDEHGIERDFSRMKLPIIKGIKDPALMVNVVSSPSRRYYFRAINWQETLLIGVHKECGEWRVKECFKNPTGQLVLEIYKQGYFLL